eukprot:31125-Pelagococcus_subviridis.AAC.4
MASASRGALLRLRLVRPTVRPSLRRGVELRRERQPPVVRVVPVRHLRARAVADVRLRGRAASDRVAGEGGVVERGYVFLDRVRVRVLRDVLRRDLRAVARVAVSRRRHHEGDAHAGEEDASGRAAEVRARGRVERRRGSGGTDMACVSKRRVAAAVPGDGVGCEVRVEARARVEGEADDGAEGGQKRRPARRGIE